jgi:uncharacterized protein (DUF1810 family)
VTDPDLVHFTDAQAQIYGRVIGELTDGRKRTHWMWFIFPQLTGLGHGALAQRYAIRNLEQARRYLADPMLGRRLRETLFAEAASDNSDRMLFQEALDQFYSGMPDPRTLELLGSSPRNMQS